MISHLGLLFAVKINWTQLQMYHFDARDNSLASVIQKSSIKVHNIHQSQIIDSKRKHTG